MKNQYQNQQQKGKGSQGPSSEMSRSSAGEHAEGPVAKFIEDQTAKLPSDAFLWAAGASIVGSLALQAFGKRHLSLFIGQWAPTFLLLGVYNKIVKVAGSDRTENSNLLH